MSGRLLHTGPYRATPSPLVGGPAGGRLLRAVPGRRDQLAGGPGVIADVLTADSLPARRRVRLHDRRTGILLRETWSDATTGAWAMHGLALGRDYIAYALDHPDAIPGEYNAAILDRVTAALP